MLAHSRLGYAVLLGDLGCRGTLQHRGQLFTGGVELSAGTLMALWRAVAVLFLRPKELSATSGAIVDSAAESASTSSDLPGVLGCMDSLRRLDLQIQGVVVGPILIEMMHDLDIRHPSARCDRCDMAMVPHAALIVRQRMITIHEVVIPQSDVTDGLNGLRVGCRSRICHRRPWQDSNLRPRR